ncbi:hypothetical protein ACUW9N_000016 [Staphylococcus auricularis]|uniref:Lactococcin 972 family bacteriocin n=1 Tax=Staphylococcus auricularis TaxID=29379 RepID=A0AAP8TSQ4_9STAP|nr:hypothetical protein [Staphylococcus auricularis]MCG7342336.1 hypothetical protein [Staphylococcus auricularis]MDC6326232.1 hypothetical protein [Staphylococcus auricularis]MDN4533877.1 hypothetical protein [Staphylococcus auricularis]PNZ66366.1 hypothetical protein CD158_08730 [Staphylococcus auricularis]QPT05750.1 hypothetical protein I6G39_08665 [Staphylococcus auricularis]
MTNKIIKIIVSFSLISSIVLSSNIADAYTYGNAASGASTDESWNIKYNGAAWNYSKSKYRSTSFKYVRSGRTLMIKTAYNGKVTGSVWDDIRWGKKYNTKFYWFRGARK